MSTATATYAPVVGDSTWSHLREVIEHTILTDPRTLQVALGPSEIGTACDRCLVHLLAGHKAIEHVAPWLPTIGHAVHSWLDKAMRLHALASDDGDRWHIEGRVNVGKVAGVDIRGNADLFDAITGTVTDWKISGKPKIDSVRRHGASLTYQRQAQLYGKGYEDAGHTVRSVQIIFLPRNAVSLQGGICWYAPYDRQIAQQTLDRANALHAGVTALGADAVLQMTAPHTGEEFDCDRWPGETSPATERQLDGLIPQTPGTPVTGSRAHA